jgi:hypothetical protein
MKIRHTVLGRLLAHGLALLAQPSGRGTRAGPHQWRYGADPRRGRRAQRVLVGGLAVTDLRRSPAGGHGEGPGKAPGMVRWWGCSPRRWHGGEADKTCWWWCVPVGCELWWPAAPVGGPCSTRGPHRGEGRSATKMRVAGGVS